MESVAVTGSRLQGNSIRPAWSWFVAAALLSVSLPAQEPAGEIRMVLVPADRIRAMEESQRVVTGLLKVAFEDVEAAGEMLGKKSDVAPVLEAIAGAGRMSHDLARPSTETTDGLSMPLIGFCGETPETAWTKAAVRSRFSAISRVGQLVHLVESFNLREEHAAVAPVLRGLEEVEGMPSEVEALLTRAESRLVQAMQVYETAVAGPFARFLAEGAARLKDASAVSQLCRQREHGSSASHEDRRAGRREDPETPDLELAQVTRARALGAIQSSLTVLDAVVLPEGSSLPEVARGFAGPVRTKAVAPVYSSFGRRACLEGEVRLLVGIGRDGVPQRIRVLQGFADLSEAAVAAAEQWRFEPATLHGEPVAFDYRLSVSFDLQGAEAARCRELRRGSP